MPEVVFKRNMSIGDISAEADGEFLDTCFIETPEYEELKNYSNKKMILLGRTGSGKTALLNNMKKNTDFYIEIRPDVFAIQYIINIPFVNFLKEEGVNLDILYKFLWFHEILSQIIKQYFTYNKKSNLIDEISKRVNDKGRISQLERYTREYEGVFFDEGSTEKITKDIEKQLSATLGNDLANLRGSLTESQKKEIQTKASQYINKQQINQLKNIITLFKEYFQDNKQKKIVVGIDNLDQNWIEDESKYQLINALLSTLSHFADVPNIKVLIATRADLFTKTCSVTKRQNEKDNSFTLRLSWTRKMLEELLDKRINYLFQYKYKKKNKITYREVFNCKIQNANAADYILDRTMLRPRDAIEFVNFCITEADGAESISEKNVLDAEKIYKAKRFEALQHEWANTFGDLDIYMQILYYLGNIFEYKNLLKQDTYEKIKKTLYASAAQHHGEGTLVGEFDKTLLEDSFGKEKNIKAFLGELFVMGLVGVKRNKQDNTSFASTNRPSLLSIDFTENLIFEIHPLFAKQ